jgi:hypothetical protein
MVDKLPGGHAEGLFSAGPSSMEALNDGFPCVSQEDLLADKRGREKIRGLAEKKGPRLSTPEMNERLRLDSLRQYEGLAPTDPFR